MRLRVRRSVSDAQLALPAFLGRMRVRSAAKPVSETTVPVSEPTRRLQSHSWPDDLLATKAESLKFEVLVKRHKPLLRQIGRPWMSRCPANVGLEDVHQELLLEVWLAVQAWDPLRGVPIDSYVGLRMRNRLLAFTHKLMRGQEKDSRFLAQQIIEEKVVIIHGRRVVEDIPDGPPLFIPVSEPVEDDRDVGRLAALVVGGLPSKQARVVAGLFAGEQTDSVTERVYGRKCKRQRKAALRAFAAAAALVESSGGDCRLDAPQRTKAHVTRQQSTAFQETQFAASSSSRATFANETSFQATAHAGQVE